MSLIESINTYFDSIVILWSGYLLSILIFYLYNYKYRITFNGRTDGIVGKCILFINRTSCILPVVITVAMRGMYTGADTYNYWQSYMKFQNISFADAITYDLTGILYNALKWILFKITNGNVQIFFFLFAFVTMYLIVASIEEWHLKHGCSALLIYYCCFGPNLMNQMRQMLSVAILLYAYQYAYNKDFRKYFTLAVLAGLIHFSGLLSAVIIWVLQKEKKNKVREYVYYFVLCISVFFMQYLFFVLNIFMNATKYGTLYLEEMGEADVGIGFGLVLAIIPNVIPVFLLQKNLDKENRFRNTIFLTLPARLAGYYSYYVYRIMYYFSIQSIIALPIAIENSKKNRNLIRIFLYGLSILYFLLFYVWKGAEIYFPYATYF